MGVGVKDAVTERFIEICEERSIRPNELATLSGVTPSTVYSMLNSSRRDISILTIKKLCDGLEISIPDFFDTEYFRAIEQEIE